ALLACLVLLAGGCGHKGAALAAKQRPQPQSLAEALSLIQQEESEQRAAHSASAVPDTLFGDQDWAAGPSGNYFRDQFGNKMTLNSNGTGPDDPLFIGFAIYQLANHGGDAVDKLALNLNYNNGEYYIYAVDYTDVTAPQWHS